MSGRYIPPHRRCSRQRHTRFSTGQLHPWQSPHHHHQQWVSKRIEHHQHHRNQRQCYRCGQNFNYNHLSHCKARFVRCFGCNKFGHFSFMCANNRHTSVTAARANTVNKQKHSYSYNHGCVRKNESNYSKTVSDIIRPVKPTINNQCAKIVTPQRTIEDEMDSLTNELPFSKLDTESLKLCENSSKDRVLRLENRLRTVMKKMEEDKIAHRTEVLDVLARETSLREQLSQFEQEKVTFRMQHEKLKIDFEKICAENEELANEFIELTKENARLRITSVAVDTVKRCEDQRDSFAADIRQLQERCDRLQSERNHLDDENRMLADELKQINRQRNQYHHGHRRN